MKPRIYILAIALMTAVSSAFAVDVTLNFFVGHKLIHEETVTAGSKYTLSNYVSGDTISACRDYTFYGWKAGNPVGDDFEPSDTALTVTPTANVNLYAVFRKAATNRYIRITTLDNLHAGSNYLIVCYYFWGGEHQYYALSNQDRTYSYKGNTYHKIDATRLYPNNGSIVISAESEDLVWTLKSGTEGTWKWQNAQNNKWLRVQNNQSYALVADSEGDATLCDISVANGIYSIINSTSTSYSLKYVDDDVDDFSDFFVTGTPNDYPIYLYKKESQYTSYPDCDPWTAYLDAVDGKISGTSPLADRDTLTEGSAGSNVTLPSATMSGGSCGGWSFAGWHVDSPVEGTSTQPALISAGSYSPLYNGVSLYAVYTRTETITKYTKVTASSLTAGEDYIIAVKDGDEYYALGNTEHFNSSVSTNTSYDYSVARTSITVNASDEIVGAQSSSLEWRYNSSQLQNRGNTSVYLNPKRTGNGNNGNPYVYHILGSAQTLSMPKSGGKWAIYSSSNTYANLYYGSSMAYEFGVMYSSDYYYQFYFFKKTTATITTYNSYPHCAPYSITLHGCGGTVGSTGKETDVRYEDPAGSGIKLPTATPVCRDGWSFVGWFIDEELESCQDTVFTDFKAANSIFYPKSDNTHLYAIYQKETEKFKIVKGPGQIRSGDTYLITYYASDGGDDKYDFELSSEANGDYLTGVKGVAPQNGAGYYMLATDSTVMWQFNKVSGETNKWFVVNMKNNKKLDTGSSYTKTVDNNYAMTVLDAGDNFAMNIGYKYSDDNHPCLYYSGGVFVTSNRSWYSSNELYGPWCYLYRRVKEFTSWPHCDPFVVHFNPCGGTTDEASLTEDVVYEGVELPEAYATSDCSRENWTFAGWAEAPVTEETDLQTFDLLPAHTTYHPVSQVDTLYAVFQVVSNDFKRISTEARLHTGTNYIIATSGNYALKNTTSGDYVQSQSVSPNAAQVITSENTAIYWRLEGEKGEYELHNVAGDVYLDLHSANKAFLTNSSEDQFHITYSESKGYAIRSAQNISDYCYLGYSSSTFRTVASGSRPTLYFYRQQATYNSYPDCIDDVEPIYWVTDETGSYVVVESYMLGSKPIINNSIGTPTLQEDGTYLVQYDAGLQPPCSKASVEWDGTSAELKIPYVINKNTDSDTLLADVNCTDCNVYVMSGNTFTVNESKIIHGVTVQDGAVLSIADGATLRVNQLVLSSEGDQNAPIITLNSTGAIVLKNNELFHDRRVDEDRCYWMTLPYDAAITEISYANEAVNGGIPVHGTNYAIYYYDGAHRANDADAGFQRYPYWTAMAGNGTMQAGQGYLIGIANQKTINYNGQNYCHKKRVYRFTMRPDAYSWNTQEREGSKVANITPSTCIDPLNAVHAGWNLIGNPYLNTYNAGSVTGSSGLRNGAWTKQYDVHDKWTGFWILDTERATNVPYITFYNPADTTYSQEEAAGQELRPFEAVFVQINAGSQINFAHPTSISAMPAYMRFAQEERPLRTGIILSGNGQSDKTGIVLSEEYTKAYEIGADLQKMTNNGRLNLYTIDSVGNNLAFLALSDEDAKDTIPVGVMIPSDGTYTFAFDAERYNLSALDTLQLIDKTAGKATNLLYSNYEFVAQAGKVNNRFCLIIRRAKEEQQITTDIDNLGSHSADKPRKIIRDGQLFILYDDKIYNAVGTQVK